MKKVKQIAFYDCVNHLTPGGGAKARPRIVIHFESIDQQTKHSLSSICSSSSMADVKAKIAEIEAEMARTQKNKATNYHLGTLKAKLAKLRSELIDGPGGKSSGTKNAERGFDVTKSGDTRIGLGTLLLCHL